MKGAGAAAMLAAVERCAALPMADGGVVINDRLDVALAGGVDGVHLGQTICRSPTRASWVSPSSWRLDALPGRRRARRSPAAPTTSASAPASRRARPRRTRDPVVGPTSSLASARSASRRGPAHRRPSRSSALARTSRAPAPPPPR